MADTDFKALSTGNAQIDKTLGGGIPMGSLVLIEGVSDSGKSVLVQQITWGTLKDGYRTSMLTTENTVKSFIRQMDSLNLSVTDYLLLRRLSIFPVKASKAKNGLKGLEDAILAQATNDVVIVDSLTSFIADVNIDRVIGFFEECKGFCNEGLTVLVVVHSHALEPSALIRIGSLCDAHLRLSIENVGTKLMKILEVAKVRGAAKATGNIVTFDVEPGLGMKIMPFSKAKA